MVHAFITSKIDIGNSLLHGITKTQLHRLQRIQNIAAKLITYTKPQDFLLLSGQRTPSEPVQFFKAPLPASDIQSLSNLLVIPNIKSYLDYNPLNHDIYWTDYNVYGDVTIPNIHMAALNSLTKTSVVNRNFQAESGDEAQSLEEICPNKWENFGDYSYLVESPTMTQPQAVSYCMTLGGQLASVQSQDVNEYLQAKAQEIGQDIWIGLEDLNAPDDTYAWIDGSGTLTDIYFTSWNSGEPNNAGNEDCATIRTDDGLWNDLPCSLSQPYVCKRLKGTNCPVGWQELDTHCYIAITTDVSFDTAAADCETRGAILTSITSQEENDFIAGDTYKCTTYTPSVPMGDEGLTKVVDHFKYLEAYFSADGSNAKELNHRIGKASDAFKELEKVETPR
ncbi:uncharacterized protein [Amphiura filiformis]|uniref:uncharacterized protein n=1 Tax=Amphiura filiformis TaxID=82378 RepID=UPI003B21F285